MTYAVTVDAHEAADIARDLQKAAAAINPEVQALANQLGVDATVFAKSVVHIVTGLLQASLHPEGPFLIAEGTFEEVVSPSPANYAEQEIARGGTHDYAAQTIEGVQPQIDALAQQLGLRILAYLRGAA